jgi:hypothetical protein
MSEISNEEVIQEQNNYQHKIKENNSSKEKMMNLRKSDDLYIAENLQKMEQDHKTLETELQTAEKNYKTQYNEFKKNITESVENLIKEEEENVDKFKTKYEEYLNQYGDHGFSCTTTIKPIEIEAPTQKFSDLFEEENKNLNALLSSEVNNSMGLVR